MALGSLLSELQRVGIGSKIAPKEISLSVKEVVNRLGSIKVIVPDGQYRMMGDSHDHANCSSWEYNIRETWNRIVRAYPSPAVGALNRDHMAKRRDELVGSSTNQNETHHGQKRKRSASFEDPVKAEASTAAPDFQDQIKEEKEDGSEDGGRRLLHTIKYEDNLDSEDHGPAEEYDEEDRGVTRSDSE